MMGFKGVAKKRRFAREERTPAYDVMQLTANGGLPRLPGLRPSGSWLHRTDGFEAPPC
jgi:hypothetical protein